jgi:nitrogen fixation-related uncharacterized protein
MVWFVAIIPVIIAMLIFFWVMSSQRRDSMK